MKMQIVSCPRCGTFLLNDTTECHGCGHGAAGRLKSRPMPTDNAVRNDMEACPNCGETCRTGLVRCWNCSTFLRPDIEESYRRMQQSGRQAVEHVELQILEATSVTEEDSLTRRVSTPEGYLASHAYGTDDPLGDDDFELGSDAQFSEDDQEGYDLSSDLELVSPTEETAQASDLDSFLGSASEIAPTLQSDTLPTAVEALTSTRDTLAPTDGGGTPTDDVPPVVAAAEPPVRSQLAEPPVRASADELPPTGDERLADDLLKIASTEEKDIQQVRKSLRSKDTFLIYCPQGCRIRVKEKHRGKTGKCPRCQSEFVVPRKQVAKKPAAGAEDKVEPVLASRYQKWLPEIRLHIVDPLKLRIKVDSLLNECQSVDLGFGADEMLVATLIAGKFGANVKKNLPIRQAMIEHFLKQGTVEALSVATKKVYLKDQLAQITVAQPAPVGTESLFADIPVFGTNRIAVKLPKLADDTHAKYLSFCLSEFRAFVEAMQSTCGFENFGTNVAVPLSDEYMTHKCHLSKATVQELQKVKWYEKDPGFKLETSGWRCAACGIVVSEAARAESKLGGANGKGIAKAKCPKCSLKFGSMPLYQLPGAGTPPEAATEPEAANA